MPSIPLSLHSHNIEVVVKSLRGRNKIVEETATATFFVNNLGAQEPPPNSDLPAFPGAEGFGSTTVGGRGGQVIYVTNLNDSGPGSLRAAIDTAGPRIVVFAVGGTITLETALLINDPYITIAGQTAPGDGITLRASENNTSNLMYIDTHDVVVRYLRFRKGPGGGRDNLTLIGGYNIVVDHSSFSWSTDENLSSWYDAHDYTLSWNIIAEPLHCSTHQDGCHGMNSLIGNATSMGNVSIHHNLYAHGMYRNPFVKPSGMVDIVNNVGYNNYHYLYVQSQYDGSYQAGPIYVNVVGNYFKYGPESERNGAYYPQVKFRKDKAESVLEAYLSGNQGDNGTDWALVDYSGAADGSVRVEKRHNTPPITTTTAEQAYQEVLAKAGANLVRDAIDLRVVDDVEKGTGAFIDEPDEVGGWPTLAAGTAPTDTDGDGMPDTWESERGLDPQNLNDGPADRDDGYTNVEEYLAWLVQ